MPDDKKSCAACCGLYNVGDGTRPALEEKLLRRTRLFRTIPRTVSALEEYGAQTRSVEAGRVLDDAIHVCEFTGFVDKDLRVPGCMLHPNSPGNESVDLRGLCHYGSMACKSFYCPAWEELEPVYATLVVQLIHDWHLYGLLITDSAYVRAVFNLVQEALRLGPADIAHLSGTARMLVAEMLSWKDSWPWGRQSTVRRSRYYVRGTDRDRTDQWADELSVANVFTFGIQGPVAGAREFISAHLDKIQQAAERAP